MADQPPYSIRPWGAQQKENNKHVLDIFISQPMMQAHGLENGRACWIDFPKPGKGPIPTRAWYVAEKMNAIQTSQCFRDSYDLSLKDKVSLQKYPRDVEDIQQISLIEVEYGEGHEEKSLNNPEEIAGLQWHLKHVLRCAEFLSVGLILSDTIQGEKRSFKIVKINSSSSMNTLYQFLPTASVDIVSTSLFHADHPHIIRREGIGGLNHQLGILDRHLREYQSDTEHKTRPNYYRGRRKCVLLYGPPGTGKTLILDKISEVGWKKVLPIDIQILSSRGSSISKYIEAVFAEARESQPSLILIDSLDSVAGSESAHNPSPMPSIAREMRKLGSARVLVLAAAQTLRGVSQSLRSSVCFGLQVEIPVPDSKARAEILKTLTHSPIDQPNQLLEEIGDRTHGFVGADLDKLTQLTVEKAEDRILNQSIAEQSPRNETNRTWESVDGFGSTSRATIYIDPIKIDWYAALLDVRPTAMQEVFLETPKVRWTDIGGQREIKHAIRQAVEWPYKHPEQFIRLGLDPPKGLLLYGPPGCSKTLTAAAVATEAGLNFLAVKGAELLSMYVGESERAVREVFRKARAAAPSILFFDEIDAIGSSRDGIGNSGQTNVLTTLLNELDGIEVLRGVFVLAATNKPLDLDPALLRPGRLDTRLHVGLPDINARREIIEIRLSKMDVEEDIDRDWLAIETKGYSGAEVVQVCRKAGYAALDEQLDEDGIARSHSSAKGNVTDIRIGKRHLVEALKLPRNTTDEMLRAFEGWTGSS